MLTLFDGTIGAKNIGLSLFEGTFAAKNTCLPYFEFAQKLNKGAQ